MAKVVAVHPTDSEVFYVVAHNGMVDAHGSIPLDPSSDPAENGRRLHEALASHVSARTKAIAALDRAAFEWQHLTLPPCPADELPEVVRMQADVDQVLDEDDIGFDFLPLAGDDETPHEVLNTSIKPDALKRAKSLFQAASLTLEHVVPLAVGWPKLTESEQTSSTAETQLFVAPASNLATLWATRNDRVVLFRQFQLSASDDNDDVSHQIAAQLKRTLLAIPKAVDGHTPSVQLVGPRNERSEHLAGQLTALLQQDVGLMDLAGRASEPEMLDGQIAPLIGLALDSSLGNRPVLDVLHPRRRPKAQVNVRTYALAAIVAALLLGVIGWSGYRQLQDPLELAERNQAELDKLEESLEQLEVYEETTAAIRDWNAEAPNLLLHLQQLSKCFRPKSLSDDGFTVEQDVVLQKFVLDKRELSIEALARDNKAVQPLEERLRQVNYDPHRGQSNPSKNLADYPWQFKATIEITPESDPSLDEDVNTAATEVPSEEPKS